MIKSCKKKSGITLQELIPTQRRDKNCNCNPHIHGFQGRTAPILIVHYTNSPGISCCNNYQKESPKRKIPVCNYFVPNGMLGRDCLKALFGKQFPPSETGSKVGFREYAEMGLKYVKEWVFMHLNPFLNPKIHFLTHFWTHFRPLTKTHLKPTLSGNKLLSKKGPWGSPAPA